MTGRVRRRPGPAVVVAVYLLCAALPVGAQPVNLEVWRTFQSSGFTLYSDADEGRSVEVLTGLERFRAVFSQLAPDLVLESPAPTVIVAFHDRESFAPYKTLAEQRGTRILGQFLSHPEVNYITLDASAKMTGALGPIYHEYVHFFVRNSFSHVPLWLHEGLAEYYSTFAIDGDRAWVGLPVERHLGWLQRNADLRLTEVLTLTNGAHGSVSGAIDVSRFYAVAWILVHYLMSGDDSRLSQVAELLVALDEGETPERAFGRAFEATPDEVEERLRDYLVRGELPAASVPSSTLGGRLGVRRRRTPPASVLVQLGGLLAIQGRTEEAEAHYQLALDEDPGQGDALAGIARLRDLEARREEAALLFADAVELEPAEARSWLWYGRHLMTSEGGPESEPSPAALARARWALSRAIRIDPGYAEARALLGYSYLFGESEPGPGIVELEAARSRLPARMDLVFYLTQLHLRARDTARARRLVEQVLEPRAEPELTQRAREEVERTELLLASDAALAEGRIEEGIELLDRAIDLTSDDRLRQRLEGRLEGLRRHQGR